MSRDDSIFFSKNCIYFLFNFSKLIWLSFCLHVFPEVIMALCRDLWSRNLLALSLLFYFLLTLDVHARPANMSSSKDKSPATKDENEILPPDHLNGLKMEMDGHLNKDFHQEVFLGKEMDDFEEDSEPKRNRKKLIEIFTK